MLPNPEPIYTPSDEAIAGSQLSGFIRHCAGQAGRDFGSYQDFERFALDSSASFWSLLLGWSGIAHEGSDAPGVVGDGCETAVFFPNLRLSYAENLLASSDPESDGNPAVISVRADGSRQEISRNALRVRVRRVAAGLRALGLGPGDRVVAIARNDATSVVACLAVAAIGATFSSAAPDMGVPAVLSRFAQLQPRLLLAHTSLMQHPNLSEHVSEVAKSLDSLIAVVTLDDGVLDTASGLSVQRLTELEQAAEPITDEQPWSRFPFNHPLFILFSSGTTGRPKCIMHGAGGTLLEHVKEHRLHGDLRNTDRLFFQTSCAWMMWNWQLSALACGATIVLYDGPVLEPETLWRIVANERVTLFGTNPTYLKLCQDRDYRPGEALDLSALKGMFSTGSILHDAQFDWVAHAVKGLPLQSISGGTDIIGCFVLGNPNLPVWRGESQCRSLGLDVRSLAREGDTREGFGELVCCNPFPSRPLGFWGDSDGSRFHAAYFAANSGFWTHGDFVEITPRGTARIHGRSDGVLNINGIRIGPAEIYQILQDFPEIRESLAIEQALEEGQGGSRMILLLTLHPGVELTAELLVKVRKELGRRGSPAHVPAIILDVPELPTTHSGKRSERAATDVLNGRPVSNLEALRNPGSLDLIVDRLARHGKELAHLPTDDTSTVALLKAIWCELFDLPDVGVDDDFFDLGGDSLSALSLVMAVEERFGRVVPISVVFRARTIGALAMVLDRGDVDDFSPLVELRPGEGRPIFIAHGMPGTLVELQDLARRLGTDRPVYGLQARGLDPKQKPDNDVGTMADAYFAQVRSVQPHGPYALIGYSFGGLVAYEVARRLLAAKEEIELLALLDTQIHPRNLPWKNWVRFRLLRIAQYQQAMRGMSGLQAARYLWQEVRGKLDGVMLTLGLSKRRRVRTRYDSITLPPQLERVRNACEVAYNRYRPVPLDTTVTLYLATVFDPRFCNPLVFWSRLAGELDVMGIRTDHLGMIVKPAVEELARDLTRKLESKDPALQMARAGDLDAHRFPESCVAAA
jgi:acetoacetyl-CoA synthetase